MIRSLDGKSPKIHTTAFVSEAAYIIGNVEIGAFSSIWPGTVIRADAGKISIGENTSIQDNSVVHGDADVFIGDNVVIGHRVMCHAKIVGDNVLIGNGATINDGAEIGEGSIVASGCMVVENMIIDSQSLVMGIPAKIRGPVEDRHTELITKTAEAYVHRGQRYKKQGNLE
ncbi:MAG: gamma carbonic anhydrase family protein [Anaerolineales bacterium]|nr:gamma carbonic anhydrase family protein [Anaerolineales bacterium]